MSRYSEMFDLLKAGQDVEVADFLEQCDEPIIFLTGNAGSGKSSALRRFTATTRKKVLVCAPTGIAALNCGGATIHKLFGMPVGILSDEQIAEIAQRQRKAIKIADVLILDESSMCSSPMLDTIDRILRKARKNPNRPFGGIQVILTGDVYQLPPVMKDNEWQVINRNKDYDTTFFFGSKVLRECAPLVLNMERIFRQTEREREFINILNAVRSGHIDDTMLDMLNSRVRPDFKEVAGYVSIASTNREVDIINRRHLESLPGPEQIFSGLSFGEFNEKNAPCDTPLSLRIGAQVMFVANNPSKSYANGTVGHVEDMEPGNIKVRLLNGTVVTADQFTWENIKYDLSPDGKVVKDIIGSYTGFPLRVAAAITVHRIQGSSLDRAIIDSSCIFESGQLYVALSRCRSLSGLVLRSPVTRSVVRTDPTVVKWFAAMQSSGRYFPTFQRVLLDQQLAPAVSEEATQTQVGDWIKRLGRGEFLPTDVLCEIRDMTNSESKSRISIAALDVLIDEVERLRMENKEAKTQIKKLGKQVERLSAKPRQASLLDVEEACETE